MGTVAIYVEGLAQTNTVVWAFMAPEHGHQSSGVLNQVTGEAQLGRYKAVLEGLQWALLIGYEKVLVHTDNLGLAQQLGSSRSPLLGKLRHLWGEIKSFEGLFFRVAYFWIAPELNSEARALARTTYEQHTGMILDPDPMAQARCLELLPLMQLAQEKGLEPSRFEDGQFLLWLVEASVDSLYQLSQEQAGRLLLRLQSLTQAELFRLQVFYLRSLFGKAG